MSRRKIDESSRKATPSGMSILKRVRTDSAPIEKIVSETDEQISRLCERQIGVDVSLDGMRDRFKAFTQPTVFKHSLTEVRGERSLQAYNTTELGELRVQELRDCGLNDEEVNMWLDHKHDRHKSEGTKSKALMNPEILELRLQEIAEKITLHQEELKVIRGFSAAQSLSRHKLELEDALNQGRSDHSKLSQLVIKSHSHSEETTPESQLKDIAEDLGNKRTPIPDYGNPFPNPWTPVAPILTPSTEFVGPKERDADLHVSDDHIYSNRLGTEEIQQLPRFTSYAPGTPSTVLYVKNLGNDVKPEHLIHLFGRFRVPGDEPITCRLMTGRMRGQAFITCADIETASRCLHTLCGYVLKSKPMIISFRKPKAEAKDSTETTAAATSAGSPKS